MPTQNHTYRLTAPAAALYSLHPKPYTLKSFTFSAKERDTETGLSYFGSRYYSSDLSIWLSVDPQAAKYPGLSPYVYCANNPVKLVDPDGEKVFVANENTKKYISKYMKDQFGTDDFLKYSKNNKLKVDAKQYRKLFGSANNYQKTLLKGLKKACRTPLSVSVEIDNKKDFNYSVSTPIYDENAEIQSYLYMWGTISVEDGATVQLGSGDCSIFINDQGAESTTMSSEYGETGKSASAVFFHELLDEFLNYHAKGKTNDSSSKIEKVFYQNNALQNKGLFPRDGSDHQ